MPQLEIAVKIGPTMITFASLGQTVPFKGSLFKKLKKMVYFWRFSSYIISGTFFFFFFFASKKMPAFVQLTMFFKMTAESPTTGPTTTADIRRGPWASHR